MDEINLDQTQLEAVQLCTDISTSNRIVSVTGPAGTGKTTIIKMVYDTLVSAGYSVVVAAPTGKAAKRIREATGIREAKTIHKLLEYTMPGEIDEDTGKPARYPYPRRTIEKRLDEDVILIDEFAMVNTELYKNIISAMKPGSCLRCFGDINQLQPIEESYNKGKDSPFKILLNNKGLKSVRLTTLHRHGKDAIIAQNANRILLGRTPESAEGFTIRQCDTSKVLGAIVGVCRTLEKRGTPTFNQLDNQIIVPQTVGGLGTYPINVLLRDIYQTNEADLIMLERHEYIAKKAKTLAIPISVNDKIMITKNMYDLRPSIGERYEDEEALLGFIPPTAEQEVFNGETGIVRSIDDGYITVDLGDRIVSIPPYLEFMDEKGNLRQSNPYKDIEHAYAITTHKAQGSEYRNVIYGINTSCHYLQCRSNYYTGVTRAREAVMVIGDSKSLGIYSLRKASPAEYK